MTSKSSKQQLEHYCAYQERCHEEVSQKMYDLKIPFEERDEIIVHLIEHNFLNEERFAQAFARGKHSLKKWGRVRIVRELEFRKISSYNIKTALKEINNDEYTQSFSDLAEKQWETCRESHFLKKKKKVLDFLFRKGYEKELVYDFLSTKNK